MIAAAEFFIAGGTVPPGSLSYVERSADRELYESLLSGEYCYVLNSRQMGKSSLAVRTVSRLQEAEVKTGFVDLTRLGGATVSPEQWYAGLLVETGRTLGMRQESASFLREHKNVGAAQRYLAFLQEGILTHFSGSVVIFIDEIDATRGLPFSTDELFAGIRQLHNGRASDAELSRLTFCLLGAALPSDLIRDPRTTPFNVGRRIELRDFSVEEAAPLSKALDSRAQLERVIHWTGGHPFLTQSLCSDLGSSSDVDALVRERYLDERARETDTNLADVGNRLLGRGDPNVGDQERADTLSLFEKLLKGGISDDESNPSCARIKMSGVARLEGGQLRIRNRIYQEVFGREWIRENMPGQELRRQRRAFWKGALRTGVVSATIIALVGTLAFVARSNQLRAERAERKARYDAYVASMRTLPESYAESNLSEINRTLNDFRDNPARGWEWAYWHHQANPGQSSMPLDGFLASGTELSSDGKYLLGISPQGDRIGVFDVTARRRTRTIPLHMKVPGGERLYFAAHDRKIVVAGVLGQVVVLDFATGAVLGRTELPDFYMGEVASASTHVMYGISATGFIELNLDTMRHRLVRRMPERPRAHGATSPDGRLYSFLELGRGVGESISTVVCRTKDGQEVDRVVGGYNIAFHPGSRSYGYVVGNDRVVLRDLDTKSERMIRFNLGNGGSLVFSPAGDQLLVFTRYRTAVLWQVTGKPRKIRTFPESNGGGFFPFGRRIFTLFWDLRTYDLDTPSIPTEIPSEDWWASVQITPEGELLSVSGATAEWVRRDLLKPEAPPSRQPMNRAYSLQAGTSGRRWLRANFSKVQIEAGEPGEETPRFRLPVRIKGGDSLAFDFTSDVRYVTLFNKVYEYPSSRPIATLPVPAPVGWVQYTWDDRWLVVCDLSGTISLFRTGEWSRPKWTYRDRGSATVVCAALSVDGSKIALARNHEVIVLDMVYGRRLGGLTGNAQIVSALAWTSDGRRIASGSEDGSVRIWDASTLLQLCTLGQQRDRVVDLRFLPGDRTLASVGPPGAKLWMTEDRR